MKWHEWCAAQRWARNLRRSQRAGEHALRELRIAVKILPKDHHCMPLIRAALRNAEQS